MLMDFLSASGSTPPLGGYKKRQDDCVILDLASALHLDLLSALRQIDSV
jgi:hypothetical protein